MKREFIGIMGKLACELEEVDNVVIVHLEGQADVYTSDEVAKILEAYLARGRKNILLDAEKLTYLDSSTLAALLKIQKKLKATGGNLKLLKLGGEPLKVLRTAGFLKMFENFDDRDRAMESFQEQSM